jgi:hypothetical protein
VLRAARLTISGAGRNGGAVDPVAGEHGELVESTSMLENV